MKETVTKCNYCGVRIVNPNRLLTFNGDEIDLCSDQCRLKWWMTVANEAETRGFEIHIVSKPGEQRSEEANDFPERKFKMFPGK